MKSRGRWVLLGAVTVIYIFMLGPIAITAAVSFNEGTRSIFPPQGFSLRWWGAAFGPQWTGPFLFSLRLATLTALVTGAAGLPLALAFHRYDFPGKSVIRAMTLGPLVLPSLVTGIALLQFLSIAGMGGWIGLPALLIGHVIICLPFTVRTIAIGLHAMPSHAERAAISLGAPPLAVLREVTIPLIRPGLGAGMIFAFITSFDDINLSLFVASPQQRPLTVTIMQFLDYGFSPTLAALSILSMIIPLLLVVVFGRTIGLGTFLYQESPRG